MIVVSDASPIIALAAVGHLDLLHQLYGTVLLPIAVEEEVTATGVEAPGAADRDVGWLRSVKVENRQLVTALSIDLDPGEAEAIALAVEVAADLLLIDERRGRSAARQLGCSVTGVLGVLIEAKHQGLLESVEPVLHSLRTTAGFFFDDVLFDRVLLEAGEQG